MDPANSNPQQPLLEMIDATIGSASQLETRPIENIQWRVRQGDLWVVGGLHASGKTALVSTAAGLQRPLSGTVLWFGKDFFSLHEPELLHERKRIGVVFENGGRMFRDMSVEENIALPLRYHRSEPEKELAARVSELLAFAGLTKEAQHPVRSLSILMQQRAALARALALEPELLIVDKPLMSARDHRWWPETLRRLADGAPILKGRAAGVIVTTEDLQPWVGSAKNFAMLKNRKWHLLGTAAELQQNNQPVHRVLLADDIED